MIDVFETNGEKTIMRTSFDGEAAKQLGIIRQLSSTTFSEDFRRAVGIYRYMLQLETEGSTLRAFADDGMAEIVPTRVESRGDDVTDESTERPLSVAVNVNNETAAALKAFAETEDKPMQEVLDAVVIQYSDLLQRWLMGEQFIIESKAGKFSELLLGLKPDLS